MMGWPPPCGGRVVAGTFSTNALAETAPGTPIPNGSFPNGPVDERMTNNFQQILQMGQQVQARLSQLQAELGQRTVSCTSGGGMVTVTADGRGKIRSIRIDRSVVDPEDVDMLEDLVLAAVNEAQTRAGAVYEEEMRKLSGGLSLPFQIPGL
jgi:nucleoid-associated protein EbfC